MSLSPRDHRPGTVWKPLTEPAAHYPWSLLWRPGDPSPHITTVIESARHPAERLGWLATAELPAE
ncbi:hypothetical protein AB0O34_28745 [Sphaerisporangium sp. NPDC088356]|uniref:hypothetical protein n=1 Tax=Sphaerisporangium sp. NPDC088356 TaxID=3154871 RepID=UPI003445579C